MKKFILSLFLILRTLTLIAAIYGLNFLKFKYSFPTLDWKLSMPNFNHPLIWSWANFDGVHYLTIADKGYLFGLTQAFFPLFPILIRLANYFVKNLLLSGLLLNHIFFIISLYIFYKLARLDFKEKDARWSLIFLTLFPTAFFFLSFYTESLFLFLILTAFYFLRKKKWFLAGIVGALASATRITGIFLIPAFVYEIWEHKAIKPYLATSKRHPGLDPGSIASRFRNEFGMTAYFLKKRIIKYFSVFLPALGLLSYMLFLKSRFNDPFLFAHVQEGFGGGRTTGKLILLYQVFWRYLKMILTVDHRNPLYLAVWLEVSSSALFLGLLIIAYIKNIRKSYLIFAALAFLLPTLTGTFSSMPRYVLGLFPCFMALTLIKNKIFRFFWILICLVLMFFTTAMFTRGYWIA